MAQQGHVKVMICTVDTDMVVIAVAKLLQIGLEEQRVAFGTGKNYRHIAVYTSSIGAEKSQALACFPMHLQCNSSHTVGRSLLGMHGRETADAFHTPCSRPPEVLAIVIETGAVCGPNVSPHQ